jgi:O-antigen/teichoic acid export membrane protein
LYIYLALFLTIPLGYYRVRQIYHRERYISSFFRVFEFVAIILTVMAGYKIIMVAFIYFIVRLLNLVFVLFDLTRKFESFRLLPFGFKYREIRHLLRPGLSAMTIYMGQNFMVQGLVSIIGIGVGSAQVVLFSTTRTLVNVVKQVVGIINLSVTSEFSYAYGAGNLSLLRKIFKLASRGNALIAFILLVGLYVFGHQVISMWTGGKVEVLEPFFTLILIGAFFSTFWNTHLLLLVSTNLLGRTGIWFLGAAIMLLVINSIWINQFGLSGVAITILCFELLMLGIMLSGTRPILHSVLEKKAIAQ